MTGTENAERDGAIAFARCGGALRPRDAEAADGRALSESSQLVHRDTAVCEAHEAHDEVLTLEAMLELGTARALGDPDQRAGRHRLSTGTTQSEHGSYLDDGGPRDGEAEDRRCQRRAARRPQLHDGRARMGRTGARGPRADGAEMHEAFSRAQLPHPVGGEAQAVVIRAGRASA